MEISTVSLVPGALSDGVWIKSPSGWPGVRYKVRSFNYQPYVRARELLFAKLRREAGRKPIDPITRDAELGKLMADHLVRDWEGFTSGGTPVLCSRDLALEVLTEPERAPWREDLVAAINLASEAPADAEEDLEKN